MGKLKAAADHHFHDHKSSEGDLAFILSYSRIVEALALSAISFGISFFLNYLLLTYLNISQYGDVMLARQVLVVASTFLLMGTKNVSKRFLINYLHDQSDKYKDFIWWHVGYIFRLVLLYSIVYSIAILAFLYLDYVNHIDISHFHIAFWSLVSAPFYAFALVFTVYLLSFGYVILYEFSVQVLLNFLWVLLTFCWIVFVPLPRTWDLIFFLVTQSFLFFGVLSVFLFLCLREKLVKLFCVGEALFIDERWTQHRFASLLIDLYRSLPIMILLTVLEVYDSREAIVGHFSLAIAISNVFYLVPQSIYPLIFSHLDHLVRQRGRDQEGLLLLKKANRVVLGLNLLMLAVLLCFSREVLQLFGQGSTHMHGILMLFSFLSVIGGLYYPMLNFALISLGESKFVGTVDLMIYLVLLVGGSFIAVSFPGINCAYLYASLIVFQFLMCNFRFKYLTNFYIFKLI